MTVRTALLGAGAALLLATAGLTPASSHADDLPLHHVKYMLTAQKPIYAEIYYLDQEPPNFGDWSHNPYQFMPNVEADVGPSAKWTYELDLQRPEQWAVFMAYTGPEPGTPNFHCELTVDGAVVVSKDGGRGVLCSIRNW